jgi:hypothetical protein
MIKSLSTAKNPFYAVPVKAINESYLSQGGAGAVSAVDFSVPSNGHQSSID